MGNAGKWNFFLDKEVVGLDTELIAMLDMARHKTKGPSFPTGIPFIITDGKRDGTGKKDRNAVNNSAHLTGNAVDLRCRDYRSLSVMLAALTAAGFRRIGIYFKIVNGKPKPTHVHVDNDPTKDQDVTWLTEEL